MLKDINLNVQKISFSSINIKVQGILKLFQSNWNNKIIMIQNGFLHTSCVIVGRITANSPVNKTTIRTDPIAAINPKKDPNAITINIVGTITTLLDGFHFYLWLILLFQLDWNCCTKKFMLMDEIFIF